MTVPSDIDQRTIAEFRANGGRVGGPFTGAPMVLVHHTGRKSGQEFVTPMMYLPADDEGTEGDEGGAVYVFASNGGAAANPNWYHNLMASGSARIEKGTETFPVSVRELTGGERDAVYAEQVHRFPGFATYEQQTRGIRTIPVLELTRTTAP
ncbi:nitroreductase family deazaflavin-dependent oxidoreductase [Kineococcus aurantiacus]|uniref:Deazaflavin-dependent oxidoreductase (Nitroreductase family) n=1 Tax=Kineococcus aurantiacus TaxID=37633 RepID=A0A7Y9ARV4_9ACTN|nr:nitroreductase family deazaflavin-dependent oxidoreductase [Kineococcus aurantiacus]NYD20466.1 deazaflavin-dependent oxidoreductase (nitroreductase family) [Kineococcus aurantiacus]